MATIWLAGKESGQWRSMADFFAHQHHAVEVYSTPYALLDAARHKTPDVVVTGFNLQPSSGYAPGMDGVEMAQRLLNTGYRGDVIVYTHTSAKHIMDQYPQMDAERIHIAAKPQFEQVTKFVSNALANAARGAADSLVHDTTFENGVRNGQNLGS